MAIVNIKINNIPVQVESGATILEAAQVAGIKIPTLCYLKGLNKSGACRVCLVEVKGAKNLAASCNYPVSEGMEVFTHSERALSGRRNSVELLMSNHNKNCLSCKRNQTCELQTLASDLNIRENKYEGHFSKPTFDEVSPGIVRDTSKCVLCGRCVSACKFYQGLGVLSFQGRGFESKVGPVFDKSFNEVNCIQCGQCINVCPVGALTEKENIHDVFMALNNPNKHVIVQTAPAVRASLGEEFGYPIGTRVTGKMVAALKRCGFNRVYDTNFGADLTIMEEGTEFIGRVQKGGTLPMITSCSPGWIKYIEYEYPELLPHLSTCKSPHMMLGAIIKSYYAKTKGIDPRNIYVVSIMPCTAKKTEILRPENRVGDIQDVDAVLTTRECGRLIKLFGIDFNNLQDEEFDQDMFGEYTGAGVIFGASGGVMEAALRTVKEILENKPLDELDFTEVRGMGGIKEASLQIAGLEVNVAVASSMSMAKGLLDQIKKGTSKYHFIEIMGCPGGCINGGGQSIVPASIRNAEAMNNFKNLRAKTLYDEDLDCEKRKSHENEQIQQLYKNFLGEPCSHKSHELLHTTYSKKEKFTI
ncbi:NADH-dependent [FeFe] hydrogenase, group A6 [Anaerorhabdus furcosa]|uniref:NADP-reducing hydrogenase subunit HndD n=1 Tax=Anaerorhabdus furcosa TaxID=118967 RepID=A0A1T4PIL0_9FIRM|nr:NADH-dependent [FeFe] hydrogenase, group A6 [Anaerorhabdus furcosa]SJZ91026.1 NADP-reducing hydrogenase subunit HndD [Anaerorhabdus furcosa]